MQLRRLGRSDLLLPPFTLGTLTFGGAHPSSPTAAIGCSEAEAFRILDVADAAGIRCVDLADIYGPDGLAERLVGRWLSGSRKRPTWIIVAKVGYYQGASREALVTACEATLNRLGTDYVDVLQVHLEDASVPFAETARALEALVAAGKARVLGLSNYTLRGVMRALALRSSAIPLEALQLQYSLIQRGIEREHLPLVLEEDLGLLAWSPLAGGFLTGKVARDAAPAAGTRLAEWSKKPDYAFGDAAWRTLGLVREMALRHGTAPARCALAWLAARAGVTSSILGVRSLEQLEDALGALDLQLPEDDLTGLTVASAPDWGPPYDLLRRTRRP